LAPSYYANFFAAKQILTGTFGDCRTITFGTGLNRKIIGIGQT